MPHSLRVRLKNLQRKGKLTEKDIDRIFKALEQEPCEDAISRQAVIDAMYELCGEGSLKDNPWRDNPHIDAIIDAIDDLPPVNPQERTGHWIAYSDGIWIKYYECSECGKVHDTCSDYCPNCGAKMVDPQERSDKE